MILTKVSKHELLSNSLNHLIPLIQQTEMEDVTLRLDGNVGLMTWSPNPEFMKEDIPQRLVLQYDINHHPAAGRVILRDGHFVHFFSPQASTVQPKHIIFVLDVSGSMRGVKLMQLKEAMRAILRDLHASHKNDYFSIVTFHSKVKVSQEDSMKIAQ